MHTKAGEKAHKYDATAAKYYADIEKYLKEVRSDKKTWTQPNVYAPRFSQSHDEGLYFKNPIPRHTLRQGSVNDVPADESYSERLMRKFAPQSDMIPGVLESLKSGGIGVGQMSTVGNAAYKALSRSVGRILDQPGAMKPRPSTMPAPVSEAEYAKELPIKGKRWDQQSTEFYTPPQTSWQRFLDERGSFNPWFGKQEIPQIPRAASVLEREAKEAEWAKRGITNAEIEAEHVAWQKRMRSGGGKLLSLFKDERGSFNPWFGQRGVKPMGDEGGFRVPTEKMRADDPSLASNVNIRQNSGLNPLWEDEVRGDYMFGRRQQSDMGKDLLGMPRTTGSEPSDLPRFETSQEARDRYIRLPTEERINVDRTQQGDVQIIQDKMRAMSGKSGGSNPSPREIERLGKPRQVWPPR